MNQRIAVVTGASSGIGRATAKALANDGWFVICAARRKERLEELAASIGGRAMLLDVTDAASVSNFAEAIDNVDLLVNNAGGAKGLDSVANGNIEDWQWMFDTNVLGTLRVTQALLPKLLKAEGQIINIGSVAAHVPYIGGAGYNAAKHGVAAMTRVLRMETADQPLRVCEIDPGRVHTEEFSLIRFGGDSEKAAKVYEGNLSLTAEDIAEAVRWVASCPKHMNIDTMRIMPTDQI
ncbi:SDR family NAD(P)-dependent oxidoreductase [Corynebacterium freiburgense]|uniref:SDR family NAD(P)-dependent oxidoreductase n=1 Tax=Corynebacterium freiburgense TaxID=556548 RepID=UPI0003F5E993|nr:SDR family oxidoreductase [Corynebacterium freiburgense]WJZ01370.1 Serine 3-dehydrogenase [Corynebacterium freiburgense]